jgi:integrase
MSVSKVRGRWTVTLYTGVTKANGKREQIRRGPPRGWTWHDKQQVEHVVGTEPTEKDAEAYERHLLQTLANGGVEKEECPTVDEYWPDFIRTSAAKGNSPSEIASKGDAWKYLHPIVVGKQIDKVNWADALDRLDLDLSEKGRAPKTRRNHRGTVKRMLRLARRKWPTIIIPDMEPIPCPQRKGRAITLDEYKRLIAACADPEIRTVIALGFLVGLRIGESLGLQWRDVDLERGTYTLRIRDGQIRRGRKRKQVSAPGPLKEAEHKDGDEIVLPLLPDAIAYLKAWRAECPRKSGYVTAQADGSHWTYWMVRKDLERVYRDAGVEPDDLTHGLRRGFGTRAHVELGYKLGVVSKLLTHKSVAVTERYLGIRDDSLIDLVRSRDTQPQPSV